MLVGSVILETPCSSWGPKAVDITGQRTGTLTAEKAIGRCKHGQAVWLFRCDCGNTRQLRANVINGTSAKSCGCKTAEWLKRPNVKNKTHGMSHQPVYAVWNAMRLRCSRPSQTGWTDYGGRGITVCPAWDSSFAAFWRDMGPTYKEGLTIERKDNDKGYSPDNCTWATRSEQLMNQRPRSHVVTPAGVMSLTKAAKTFGIPYGTFVSRVYRGWPAEKIFRGAAIKQPQEA